MEGGAKKWRGAEKKEKRGKGRNQKKKKEWERKKKKTGGRRERLKVAAGGGSVLESGGDRLPVMDFECMEMEMEKLREACREWGYSG